MFKKALSEHFPKAKTITKSLKLHNFVLKNALFTL